MEEEAAAGSDALARELRVSWTPRLSEVAMAHAGQMRSVLPSGWSALFSLPIAGFALYLSLFEGYGYSALLLSLAGLFVVFAGRGAWAQRAQWRARFAADPTLGEPCELVVADDGATVIGPRVTTTSTWAAYAAWYDQPAAVVLASGETGYARLLVVPHRALLGDQADALRGALDEHLGPAVEPRRRGVPWLQIVTVGVAVAAVVLALLTTLVPSAAPFQRTESASEAGAKAPERLDFRGTAYERVGGPVDYPEDVAGYAFTPGGGLILVKTDQAGLDSPAEVWVINRDSVVRRYELAPPTDGTVPRE